MDAIDTQIDKAFRCGRMRKYFQEEAFAQANAPMMRLVDKYTRIYGKSLYLDDIAFFDSDYELFCKIENIVFQDASHDVKRLQKQIKHLDKKLAEIESRIAYMPYSENYTDAKEEFDKLKSK